MGVYSDLKCLTYNYFCSLIGLIACKLLTQVAMGEKKSPFMEEHCSTILLHRLLPSPQQPGYEAMFPRTMCDRVPNILQHQL